MCHHQGLEVTGQKVSGVQAFLPVVAVNYHTRCLTLTRKHDLWTVTHAGRTYQKLIVTFDDKMSDITAHKHW